MSVPKVTLRERRELSLRRLHPWIFSGAIESIEGDPPVGTVVEVYSKQGDFLAVGHYEGGSIAVKVLSFRKTSIDENFFKSRFQDALSLRKHLGLLSSHDTNAYRLINGEGDFLPGLIIDLYNNHAVVQCHSIGMHISKDLIVSSCKEIFGKELQTIFARNQDTLPDSAEESSKVNEFWFGDKHATTISENGIRYHVDWVDGQKTGFYLDQRENRKLLRTIAEGKRILNMFSFTGGFTLSALMGGATRCDSVDSSAWTLDELKRNLELNNLKTDSQIVDQDCFKFLQNLNESYDCIVLDPPPFAKSRSSLENALGGYKALNHHAVKHLERGGHLLTFSCSQVVSREAFKKAVSAALSQAGRNASIVREFSSAPCHPASLHHPEGEYLKGLLLRVS